MGNHQTKLGIEKIPACPDVTVMSFGSSFQVVPAGFCGRFAQLMPSGNAHFSDSNIEASTNGSQPQQEDRSECGGRPRHEVNCLLNAMARWRMLLLPEIPQPAFSPCRYCVRESSRSRCLICEICEFCESSCHLAIPLQVSSGARILVEYLNSAAGHPSCAFRQTAPNLLH